jgi:hypothetical protein
LRLFQCRHQRIGRHAHQLPPIGAISAHYTTLTRKIKCKALGSLPDLKFKSGAAA